MQWERTFDKSEFVRWAQETRPDQDIHTTQFIDNEKRVRVTKVATPNSKRIAIRLNPGSQSGIGRQVSKRTTATASARPNPRDDLQAAKHIIPNAMDVAGLMRTDPMFVHGNFWREVVEEGEKQNSGIRVPGWIRGHSKHCSQCSTYNEAKEWDLEQVPDAVLVHNFRDYYDPECYGSRLAAYLIYGYLPKMKSEVQPFEVATYKSLYKFQGMRKAYAKQKKMPNLFGPGDSNYINSLTGSERPSDVEKARASGTIPKCRICLDMGRPNACMHKWDMRYEDVVQIMMVVQPHEYWTKSDFDAFYLRLPPHRKLQRLQSFRDPFTKEVLCYAGGIAFGICVGCTFASCVSSEARLIILHEFRKKGLATQLHPYLDDYMGRSRTEKEGNESLIIQKAVCNEKLGLPISDPKTVQATQRAEILGVIIDTSKQTLSVKPKHRQQAKALIEELDNGKKLQVKKIERLCGLLNFLAPLVLGARPYLRAFWRLLALAKTRRRRKHLRNGEAKEEDSIIPGSYRQDILWWKKILEQGFPKDSTPWLTPAVSPTVGLATDASGNIGCGAWSARKFYYHRWFGTEKDMSVPEKELYAIHRWLLRNAPKLSGTVLVAFTDSISNVYCLNAGSSKSKLQNTMIKEISSMQRTHHFAIVAVWLPREFNPIPDMLSKGELTGENLIQSARQHH